MLEHNLRQMKKLIAEAENELKILKSNQESQLKRFPDTEFAELDINYFQPFIDYEKLSMIQVVLGLIFSCLIIIFFYNYPHWLISILSLLLIWVGYFILELLRHFWRIVNPTSFTLNFNGLLDVKARKITNIDGLKKLRDELLNSKTKLEHVNAEIMKRHEDELIQFDNKIKSAQYDVQVIEDELITRKQELFRHKRAFWHDLDGHQFEYQVYLIFKKLGYQVFQTSLTDDEGIDLIIKLGYKRKRVFVQCKHYTKKVTPSHIREFQGATKFSKKSIFIGSNGFTERAIDQSKKSNMLLLDLTDVISLNKREDKICKLLSSYLK